MECILIYIYKSLYIIQTFWFVYIHIHIQNTNFLGYTNEYTYTNFWFVYCFVYCIFSNLHNKCFRFCFFHSKSDINTAKLLLFFKFFSAVNVDSLFYNSLQRQDSKLYYKVLVWGFEIIKE